MLNILTIDLEDYFQVHAFSRVIRYEDWDNYECRIERNTDRLLEILEGVTQNSKLKTQNSEDVSDSSLCAMRSAPCESPKGTFFILGWIAERYPGLVRRIQKEGHEIACHGYAHKLVYLHSKEEFRNDIKKAKAILEDITGSEVIGYRAPSYSITNKSQWAFEVLVEEGFKYDSSIFPIRHDFYGMANAPRFPFVVSLNGNSNVEFSVLNCEFNTASLNSSNTAAPNNSFTHSLIYSSSDVSAPQDRSTSAHYSIIEFPISTVKLLGMNFPISGGGYFRLLPYPIIRRAFRSINEKEQKPFIFYIHPWEVDFEQPRIRGLKLRSRLRHYINLDKTESKFRRLLEDFQFSTIRQMLIQNS
jgi:polysaccharide deacetylase family protein (PEP-CTERM system associated)